MKTTYCFLFSLLCAVAIPLTAPAQQAANPYDWFKMGETEFALGYFAYYQAISDSLQDKLREHQALLKKLDAPDDVLSAFSSLAQVVTALPFSKGGWDQWTSDEQQKWKNDFWPAYYKFSGALVAYVRQDRQRRFFYWIGLQSIKLGWGVPYEMQTYGYTLAQEMSQTIQPAIVDFATFNGSEWNDIATTLTPEARDGIKTIVGIGAKANDPLAGGGTTQADVDKIAAAAQTIRQLARDNKLVSSQRTTANPF
jgi:hypothetical protein